MDADALSDGLRRGGVSAAVCVHRMPAFRRTVPGLLFSETEPEDLDTRMEDHVADESRYLCMARPIPPRRVETALPVQDDPLNMLVRR